MIVLKGSEGTETCGSSSGKPWLGPEQRRQESLHNNTSLASASAKSKKNHQEGQLCEPLLHFLETSE